MRRFQPKSSGRCLFERTPFLLQFGLSAADMQGQLWQCAAVVHADLKGLASGVMLAGLALAASSLRAAAPERAASTGLQRDDEMGRCLMGCQPVTGDDQPSSQQGQPLGLLHGPPCQAPARSEVRPRVPPSFGHNDRLVRHPPAVSSP